MVEATTVRKLLGSLESRLGRLQDLADVTAEEYLHDLGHQEMVERNLQVGIQSAIDLGLHVLADFPSALPATNREVFRQLGSQGLLEADLAARLERMAGFRNLLVHGYADLVPGQVYRHLEHLGDLREYVRQMTDHLRRQGVLAE